MKFSLWWMISATTAVAFSSGPCTGFSLSPITSSQSSSSSLSSSSTLLFSATTTTTMPTTTTTTTNKLPTNDDVLIVDSMPEPLPMPLKNQYYLLRHGQSTANVASIISSDRSLAYSERHGLTSVGRQQGKDAAQALVKVLEESADNVKAGDKIVFVSSPFARAKQTAESCLEELLANDELQQRLDTLQLTLHTKNLDDIVLKENLMERYFGRLDDEAIYTYAYVWPVDKFDVTHTAFGVESVAAVCTRLRELIVDDLEVTSYDGAEEGNCHFVLTSHADVLQICQLYGANVDNVGTFSSYRFGNGEVRAMQRTPTSLPDPVPLEAPQRGTLPPPS